jgi:hypothetical protein
VSKFNEDRRDNSGAGRYGLPRAQVIYVIRCPRHDNVLSQLKCTSLLSECYLSQAGKYVWQSTSISNKINISHSRAFRAPLPHKRTFQTDEINVVIKNQY